MANAKRITADTQRMAKNAAKAEASAMRAKGQPLGLRADSWTNAYTGVGVKGVDKLTASLFDLRTKLGYNEQFALYRQNWIAKRQVDDLVSDATRAGFKLVCNDDPTFPDAVYAYWRSINAIERIGEGLRWGCVCGGALALMLTDDEALSTDMNQVMATPLEPTQMGGVRQLVVVDARYAVPDLSSMSVDSDSENFGLPEYYQVTPYGYSTNTPSYRVHWSRILRFEGVPTDQLTRVGNLMWGDSVYESSYDPMMRYGMTYQGASLAAAEFGLKVLKVQGLAQLMGTEQYEAILGRAAGVKLGLSAARIAIIDAGGNGTPGEELTLMSQPVTGLPEIMDRMQKEIAGAVHEPAARLFGTQAGALASAETDHKTRAEFVQGVQMRSCVPPLKKLTELAILSRDGPKPSKQGATWEILPNPIDPPDMNKILEQRERQAKIDGMDIANRVLEPSEVRSSRYGGAAYSHETTTDDALTKLIAENDKAALEASKEAPEPESALPAAEVVE